MSCLRPRASNRLLLILVLIALRPDGSAVQGAAGPVIVDGPWTSLPPGAGRGLALDSEWRALTLKPDLTKYAFVLSPDPAKGQTANIVGTLGVHNGRLYPGYGDITLNLGPVDILAYDPPTGGVTRERTDVPEEGLGLWHSSADDRLYVGGDDARESGAFGNFYVNDSLGWQKRRTVPNAAHVQDVLESRGRLFVKAVAPPPPVDYPFILVSDNYGASWSYERIDPGRVDLSLPPYTTVLHGMAAVTHRPAGRSTHKCLYAVVRFRKPGENEMYRLYRFENQTWTQVRVVAANAERYPSKVAAVFKDWVLVCDSESTYALDYQNCWQVPFLTRATMELGRSEMCRAVCEDSLYWILRDAPIPSVSCAATTHLLCRTKDLETWETLGPVELPAGAPPVSMAFAHGRLYLGAESVLSVLGDAARSETLPCRVYPIDNSALQWDADIPDGSQVSLKVRTQAAFTSATQILPLKSRPWVGPDGTENSSFTVSGQVLHPQHNGEDILQIAIYKIPNSDGAYPHVRTVTLVSPGGSVTRAVDEGSGLYAAVTSTDPNGAEYLSQVFELQEPIVAGGLFFDGATPDQTSLRSQVRSALAQDLLANKPFVGPNGAPGTFYQSSDEALWSGHSGDTCIQYRAVLASSSPTSAPFLRKVTLLTRKNTPDHIDIQVNGPSTWVAGGLNSIQVTARAPAGTPVPLRGSVSLSAVAEDSDDEVQVQPNEIVLADGVGVLYVQLQQAVPTRICAELAGIRGCSRVIDVQPGAPAGIPVTTSLPEPLPNWSPVGQAGQPFTLSLTVVDRYGNKATGYTGTVRCERWSDRSEDQLLPPYEFLPADHGCREFPLGVTIYDPGEWNLLCFDETTPQVAGTLTVNME